MVAAIRAQTKSHPLLEPAHVSRLAKLVLDCAPSSEPAERDVAQTVELTWPVEPPTATRKEVLAQIESLVNKAVEKRVPTTSLETFVKEAEARYAMWKVGDTVKFPRVTRKGAGATVEGRVAAIQPNVIRVGSHWVKPFDLDEETAARYAPNIDEFRLNIQGMYTGIDSIDMRTENDDEEDEDEAGNPTCDLCQVVILQEDNGGKLHQERRVFGIEFKELVPLPDGWEATGDRPLEELPPKLREKLEELVKAETN